MQKLTLDFDCEIDFQGIKIKKRQTNKIKATSIHRYIKVWTAKPLICLFSLFNLTHFPPNFCTLLNAALAFFSYYLVFILCTPVNHYLHCTKMDIF